MVTYRKYVTCLQKIRSIIIIIIIEFQVCGVGCHFLICNYVTT